MKKISKLQWNLYKESEHGKDTIALFKSIYEEGCTPEETLEIIRRFNPQYMGSTDKKFVNSFANVLNMYDDSINNILPDLEIETVADCHEFYKKLLAAFFFEDDEVTYDDIMQKEFKLILSTNVAMSFKLYEYMSDFFIPNFFVMQFAYLKEIAKKYEITLPDVPNRSDYKARCMYYFDMCSLLFDFATENGFDDKAEFCAFLFDYELPLVKEEMENNAIKGTISNPGQAWILTGNMNAVEKTMSYGFWQANQMTRKGDLMLFYEKSPVKKLNSVWIAQEDGVVDPFFSYYSHTYIGQRIDIPEEYALTYNEFRNNDYFKAENRGTKGNYVSKNFQDVSGWEVTASDYMEIKRMLEAKGYDTTQLPTLFVPETLADVEINNEADVENKLIAPMLEQMGWVEERDYLRQVTLHLGREDKGRTDFSLFPYGEGRKNAKVLIESKHNIKTHDEFVEAFKQAESYAKQQEANLLFVIDKKAIYPFEKKNGSFEKGKHEPIRWTDIYDNQDGTLFIQLKRLIEENN